MQDNILDVNETVEDEIKFTQAVEVEKPKSRKGRKPKSTNNNEGLTVK